MSKEDGSTLDVSYAVNTRGCNVVNLFLVSLPSPVVCPAIQAVFVETVFGGGGGGGRRHHIFS